MRLRCHLPIEVPEGDCGMRVGDKFAKWEVGKCLIFDDYYEHEVWNRTEVSRIVLLLDLWHPELTLDERKALDAIQWCSQQQAFGLLRYWEVNERQRRSENQVPAFEMNQVSSKRNEDEEYIDMPDH